MHKLLCLILLFGSLLGYSQQYDQKYLIDYITTKEGLSHNYVSQVISDSLNIKWIASENGLMKYDGVNFSTLKPGQKYPGLKNENIETVFLDSKNNLWIGTKSGGLSKIALESGKLQNYNKVLLGDPNAPLRIRSITEDNEGNIWIGSNDNGLFVLNNTYVKLLKHYDYKLVMSLLKDAHGNIWFSSKNMLKKYDPSESQIINFKLNEETSEITDIIEDKKRNCLWISTVSKETQKDKKIFKFNFSDQRINEIVTGIESYYFSTLFLDDSNKLWIGTWGNGLYRSNESLNEFKKMDLVYSPNGKKTINYDIILDIHKDKNKVIWISTGLGGIVKLTEGKGFKNLDAVVQNSVLKNNLVVLSAFKKDKFWVGTLRNGLFIGNSFSDLDQVKDIGNKKVLSIYEKNSMFFVGTAPACYVMNAAGHKLSTIKTPMATSYLLENDGLMWIGTQQQGLMQVNISDVNNPVICGQFTYKDERNSIGSNRITSIVRDSKNNLWIGTYNGIYLYDKDNDTFIHHSELFDESLPAIINTIYTDKDYIWLGTPDGLYQLSYSANNLKVVNKFSKEDGLSNDFICGITSYKNNLWMTTTTNIVCINLSDNSFLEFGRNDGVYTTQFNIRSFFKDNKSCIYAGGTDNMTYFDPDKIKKDTLVNSDIILTHLLVNNQLVTPNNPPPGCIPLGKNFSYVDHIELSHKEKSFAIGFSSSNFANKLQNFRYKLQGYQDGWVNIKSQNEVHFIGLPPGSYQLLLSSSNDFHNWTTPKSLGIHILYAPWSSPLAYVLYFIFFLIITGSFFHILLKQSKLANDLKKEREISEAKFTFFTNISHEFRTPLTLISGPLKEIMSTKGLRAEITEKLVTVDKNASRLLNLINQLLDFRKSNSGILKLSVSDGNFVRFTEEVFLCFKEQATTKNIIYEYLKKDEVIVFPFDRNKMEIVLCNLISNAFKYTEPGGKIKLRVEATENFCIVKLTDSGIGMSKEYESKIFDRFYQIQTTNTANIIGSGIGLSFTKKIVELHHGHIEVKSKLKKGTEFIIKFPIDPNNYRSTDFDKEIRNTDKIETYKKLELDDLAIQGLQINNKENTILIVDDNSEIRNYLSQFLSLEYNILEAKDGKQGVEIASKEGCDLILCDIMMPKMDGLTACKLLKSQISTSHIPIILLTARSSNLYEIKGLETGADDFITKPFDPKIVKARIASVLQNRSKIREFFLNKVRFEPTVVDVEKNDSEGDFINKIITAVEENLMDDDFGIEALMDISYMSQSTLYRKIKSLTGLSLTGFIRSVRLKKAAEIILTENTKLSAVSTRVGFNDYKHFRVSFVKQFGCLPSKYRSYITTHTKSL